MQPRVGLRYVRALIAVRDERTAANLLDVVLDQAHDETRGWALLVRARIDASNGEHAQAAAALIEAIDLCGDAIFRPAIDVLDEIEDGPDAPILQRLADAGSEEARLRLLAHDPDER
jgi:predicted Zn-dependent protease